MELGQFAVAAMKKDSAQQWRLACCSSRRRARHSRPPAATRRTTPRRDVDDDDRDVRQCRSDPTKGSHLKIGNVRFTRVLDADDDVEREPLLYVPGIEFRGISVAAQLPNLIENDYDPWYCWVDGQDRSSFDEVVEAVATFVRDKGGILAGESMGGLIATAAALKLSDAKKID